MYIEWIFLFLERFFNQILALRALLCKLPVYFLIKREHQSQDVVSIIGASISRWRIVMKTNLIPKQINKEVNDEWEGF